MFTCYVSSIQGHRQYMEDTYDTRSITEDIKFYGVFDGHGGAHIADLCKTSFAPVFTQFYKLQGGSADIPVAIRASFRTMDQLAEATNKPNEGSTAVIVVTTPTHIYFANAGDSMTLVRYSDQVPGVARTRAKSAQFELVSVEHKAEAEKERITQEGGIITYWDGMARVNGTLNLSRSIGDHYMKKYILSNPYIKSICLRTKNKAEQQIKWILIASDGVWDVYNPETLSAEVDKIIKEHENDKPTSTRYQNVVEHLVSLAKTSGDNITAMLLVPGV